ncbi:MAG: SIR2 family protein [Melioribacteraceae bacterium]|nr:SIR2 family protein [Melioribacteraceae bacterium]
MKSIKTKYLKIPDERDIVFVLGAGASHPDGVPLQRHILPMILTTREIAESKIGQQVTEFVKDNFAFDNSKNLYPQLEAVFGFLDYFIAQNESLSSKYTNSIIRQIKENLIKLIHFIVNLRTDKNSKVYHQFWDAVSQRTSNFSIITLNYDTLLEQSFDFLFRKFGYIDYCFHLMNYDRRKELSNFNFWINPREPVPVADNESPVPIKIIKLHGSLTWKYCSCCNQTLLTPWDRELDLNRGTFTGYTYPDKTKYDLVCPLDGTQFETLILMPSYVKPLTQPVISQLTSEAAREIRAAKKIVFIGYSLSNADLHIRALFKKQLKCDDKIYVINTRQTEAFKLKYYSIAKNVTFINRSFEDFIKNDELIDQLFQN